MISVEEFKRRHTEEIERRYTESESREKLRREFRALCELSGYRLVPTVAPGRYELKNDVGETISSTEHELATVLLRDEGAEVTGLAGQAVVTATE